MVAAHQRQPERAGDEHARDPGGAGRADVDRVEGAVGERLHGGGQAGDADREAGVVGHVDLGDGGQAQVDLGVGADDLDLEAGHAALADLFDRARDAVHRADPVGEDRHARRLAVVAVDRARRAWRARWRGRRRRGRRGSRRCSSRTGPRRRSSTSASPVAARTATSTAARSLRSCRRQARRKRPEWLKSSACISSISPRSSRWSSSTAESHARSRQRASAGERSAPVAPWRASPSRSSRWTMSAPCAGPGARTLLAIRRGPERARGQGDRRVRPLRGAALLAVRGDAAGAHVREELGGRRGGGRGGEGAPDVNARRDRRSRRCRWSRGWRRRSRRAG